MKRREFLVRAALGSTLGLVSADKALAEWGLNDLLVFDNDEDADLNQDLPFLHRGTFQPGPSKNLTLTAGGPKVFRPFEFVVAHITPYIESKFDVFCFANTRNSGSRSVLVPYQQLLVVQRRAPGDLFVRSGTTITGFTENAYVWDLIPTSTGVLGGDAILTFSGVYRFDKADSIRKQRPHPEASMSWAVYIDFVYADGNDSGVAIHGTPTRRHRHLGVRRASHGCVRVHPDNARRLKELLLSPEMQSDDLPMFNNRAYFQQPSVLSGQGLTAPGIKGLAVFFNGYQNESLDV